MPPVPMAPVMPFRRLHLSCLLRGRNRIRIQQRSGFSTLGRTGQKNKQANNQGAEYCLDVHRRLPSPRLSRLRSAIDLRLLPRFHDGGLIIFCPIARHTEIKSSGGSNYCKRGQRPKYPQQHHHLDEFCLQTPSFNRGSILEVFHDEPAMSCAPNRSKFGRSFQWIRAVLIGVNSARKRTD